MQDKLEELNELNNVVCEIRRCLNFFQDETETTLYVDDEDENFAYIIDEETGHKYMIKVEKVN